jgi:hypothetical protein
VRLCVRKSLECSSWHLDPHHALVVCCLNLALCSRALSHSQVSGGHTDWDVSFDCEQY